MQYQLEEAAKLAGFKAECGGGGDTTLILECPNGHTICFGYANGPLGWTESTEDGQYPDGGDMLEGVEHSVQAQAEYIQNVAIHKKAGQRF